MEDKFMEPKDFKKGVIFKFVNKTLHNFGYITCLEDSKPKINTIKVKLKNGEKSRWLINLNDSIKIKDAWTICDIKRTIAE